MKNHQQFYTFLLIWIILNIITACSVELYTDEAYYWMYSKFLDWGYFDHPPAIAVMIGLGSFLGKSEIAVRIVNILLTSGSIALIYHMVKPKNVIYFCLTVFCFLIIHLVGFVSLPDTPFLFFSLLFMIAYKNFLDKESLINQIALGVFAALMLYSKYHGGLVILFVVLSNPRLLLNYRFYIAGLIGLVLFAPHIYWQISHEFPSLKYHLVDRADSNYHIGHTLDFVFGNIPFLGGLVSVVLFIASFYYHTSNKWEDALKWNLYETLIFFFLITFKGQYIEGNWTIFCVVPLIYFGYKYIEDSKWMKSYKVLVGIFAVVFLVFNIHLIHPLFIVKNDRVWDFHNGKQFVKSVDSIAKDRFITANCYQDASLLNFYSNLDYYVPSLNFYERANQYDLWRFDTLNHNKDIAFVSTKIKGIVIGTRNFETTNVSLLDSITSLDLVKEEIDHPEELDNVRKKKLSTLNDK